MTTLAAEDTTVTAEPGSGFDEARIQLRNRALNSLFFFNKAVLGMKALTPEFHGEMSDFISHPGHKRKRLQAPRTHIKTWNCSIGKRIWKNIRFLYDLDDYDDVQFPNALVSSTATNAERMSRDAARLWSESPLRAWLFPEVEEGPEWSKKVRMFDVKREGRLYRRAITEFFGVGAKASSRHYRALTLDDLHAIEEATDSPPAVEDVVDWYKHTESLLIEPVKDEIDVIGTPCSMNPADIYLYIDEKEPGVYVDLRRPCYNPDGQPAWPERFPRHILENIRRKQGDFLFSLQYLLLYIDPNTIEFKTNDFVRYTVAGDASRPLYILEDGRRYFSQQLSTCATVDLAGWRGEGDDNAILVAGVAKDEMCLLLEAWRKRCPPDELIDKIVELHQKYLFPVIGVEEVAYQQCLSYYLERRIEKDCLALSVQPINPPRGISKDTRIRSMQPITKERRIAICDELVLFLEELTRFPKGKKHLLDCFAYLPKVWQTPFDDELIDREDEMRTEYLRAMGNYGAEGVQ